MNFESQELRIDSYLLPKTKASPVLIIDAVSVNVRQSDNCHSIGAARVLMGRDKRVFFIFQMTDFWPAVLMGLLVYCRDWPVSVGLTTVMIQMELL